MAHILRPGDRVRLLADWLFLDDEGFYAGAPRKGDVGTFVGGNGGQRAVFDRPATHRVIDLYLQGIVFNGKQSWGNRLEEYHYLGWRVNPDKV